MTIESRTLETEWGSFFYRTSGSGEDVGLIFIHGALGDSRLFRHQLRHFGQRFRTLAPDLPGHSRSMCDGLPTMDRFIDSIMLMCAHEGIGKVILVGHSMGGGIAFELYARGLLDIAAMVFVSTAPVLPIPGELRMMIEQNDAGRFSDILVRSVFSKKTGLLVELARKGAADLNMAMIRNDMDICGDMDYTGLLPGIDVPVLLVANRGDRVVTWENTSAMASSIPDSRVILFDHEGHVPFFEYGEDFNATLDSFFNEIAAPARGFA